MSVVVTGATGQLGRLVVESLLERGYPAEDITATGRDTARIADLADRGVTVRRADFEDPESLREAFRGADTVLLVSGTELGRRVEQHGNAIQAARGVGVGHLVYTSAPRADETTLVLAPEHRATEELLAASGLTHTVLRNGWYNELSQQALEQARAHGAFAGSAGRGRTASAARRDLAEAAAVVLADPAPHAGAVHELSGDTAWTNEELARDLGELLGREVRYRDLSPEEHRTVLAGAGLDEDTVEFVVTLDRNVRDGELAATPGTLSKLIGRPTTPVVETLRGLL
ncbi:NAD(P)-dependent oxidoreductase [Nocardiopsis terrae]|uniref:NAD(P)H dehydrogenase (Quinone) n=1 Tax=Nocardiopsis terrae TaxID=372655 RepID=A0ABR9HGC7_9ACTN|nr:SDR family oxidoreductase [Nocardiopsis terrae]MBE1458094.1 NAD(P)H dehydrogenase (quinone) [Nocardiopsis terrae]GHC82230.1 NAD(P)-dependent oxidoreductase [Nocardiopsis terrae]